jgi:hypothetical protein
VPQPTGDVEEIAGDALTLRSAGRRPLLVDPLPGIEIEGGVVEVDKQVMTGHPGVFAGADMVPATRSVTDAWLRLALGLRRQSATVLKLYGKTDIPSYAEALSPQTQMSGSASTTSRCASSMPLRKILNEYRVRWRDARGRGVRVDVRQHAAHR